MNTEAVSMARAVNYKDAKNTDFWSAYRISASKEAELKVFPELLLGIRKWD